MKTVKVLFLDDTFMVPLSVLERAGIKIEMTDEHSLGIDDSYAAITPISAQRIAQEAQRHDLIIIGNNLRAGIEKAAAIPTERLGRVIVVWNDYRKGDERPYAALGISQFGSRRDTIVLITEALREIS